MGNKNNYYLVPGSELSNIGDAIREKVDPDKEYAVDEMAAAIRDIHTGTDLPDLTNPASASHILKDKQAIDENGNVLTGTLEPTEVVDCDHEDAVISIEGLDDQFVENEPATGSIYAVSDIEGLVYPFADHDRVYDEQEYRLTVGYDDTDYKLEATLEFTTPDAGSVSATKKSRVAPSTILPGLSAENIKAGVIIGDVQGTYTGGNTITMLDTKYNNNTVSFGSEYNPNKKYLSFSSADLPIHTRLTAGEDTVIYELSPNDGIKIDFSESMLYGKSIDIVITEAADGEFINYRAVNVAGESSQYSVEYPVETIPVKVTGTAAPYICINNGTGPSQTADGTYFIDFPVGSNDSYVLALNPDYLIDPDSGGFGIIADKTLVLTDITEVGDISNEETDDPEHFEILPLNYVAPTDVGPAHIQVDLVPNYFTAEIYILDGRPEPEPITIERVPLRDSFGVLYPYGSLTPIEFSVGTDTELSECAAGYVDDDNARGYSTLASVRCQVTASEQDDGSYLYSGQILIDHAVALNGNSEWRITPESTVHFALSQSRDAADQFLQSLLGKVPD